MAQVMDLREMDSEIVAELKAISDEILSSRKAHICPSHKWDREPFPLSAPEYVQCSACSALGLRFGTPIEVECSDQACHRTATVLTAEGEPVCAHHNTGMICL